MSNYLSRPPANQAVLTSTKNLPIEEESKIDPKHSSVGTTIKSYRQRDKVVDVPDVHMIEEDVYAENVRDTEMNRSTIALNLRFNDKNIPETFKNSFRARNVPEKVSNNNSVREVLTA